MSHKTVCVFHSYSESLYAHITGDPHAYTRAVSEIRDLIGTGGGVCIKTFVNFRPLYRSIDRTTRAINELFGVDEIIYSGVEMNERVIKHPNIIVPLRRTAPYLTRGIDAAIDMGMTPHVMLYPIESIPLPQRGFVVYDYTEHDLRSIEA